MKNLEERYQKLSPREHVLKRPETYIGSTTTEKKEMYVVENLEDIKFLKKEVDYNPAFIKIFDEVIVNASDHYIRTNGEVKKITIQVEEDSISIMNDGPGIPIEMNEKEKMYIPELIFGNLFTGENFDDTEERMVGGRNGFGSKLTNIYSKKFIVDCADGKNRYQQTFHNNLSRKTTPKINKSKKSYTKITFYPDFEKFGLEKITEEIKSILLKRSVDIAVYCPKLKVYFNDVLIPMKNFKDYIKMYMEDEEYFTEIINENWEIGISKSHDDQFEQVSMVNGIFTYDGGTHVNYITNQITKKIADFLTKKYKGKVSLTDIERNLFVFVNCKIPNPGFTSQTKEKLITKISRNSEVSDTIIKKVLNSEIVESIIRYIEAKEAAKLRTQSSGKKSKIRIKKLDDANKAGTKESSKCLLFLTEGDSAKSFVLSGIEKKDKDYYGAFPLRGKILNVRDVPMAKILENEEIKNIINILGLKHGEKYTSTDQLRYGKIVISTDSDSDGLHIKGLLINLIHYFWPELLDLDFLYEFVTPIARATKGSSTRYFYKLSDYKKFRDSEDSKGYFFKYYKGLGTIEPKESKKFFKNLKKHLIRIEGTGDRDIIDMLFSSKRVEERKNWLLNYKPDLEWDKFSQKTDIDSFFNKEFIEFSMYDNIRSIPSVVDGLKPSHRKIIYTLFKKNFKNEIKVNELSGSVISTSAYHHGPASLEQSIIDLAQDYLGSNNVNLLSPNGGFGTRLQGGGDSSAPRYIFTELKDYTRKIFKKEDDPILDYLQDDGKEIEPSYYVPIIPMILINGSKGIGTGYSTDIPMYDYKQIINWYLNKLQGKENRKTLIPTFKGFKGTIEPTKDKNRFISKGVYKKDSHGNIRILELPIGVWTEKYVDHLHNLLEKKKIKDFTNNCTDTEIDFSIIVNYDFKESDLKITSDVRTSNMMLFDRNCVLKKYEGIEEILEDFYETRLDFYEKRKKWILEKKARDKFIIQNKGKFIQNIISGKLLVNNKTRKDIEEQLSKLKIDKLDDSYDYLLNMNILSLTTEKLNDIKKQFTEIKNEIKSIEEKDNKELWIEELKEIKIK